jgi:3-phenylpropionate/trans-cinnamate dioxygenase ferredoxin reductase subunit
VSGSEGADVLLVGGGVASVRCARTLRRHGFTGSIVLVGAEPALPYNRPPLSKDLLRDDLPDDLVLAEAESWYERRGIELRLGVRAAALDAEARTVTLDDGRALGYQRCLLATGAEPRILPVPGADQALLLRTLPDARRLRSAAMALATGAPVTVIGGGFIGIEVASGLAGLGRRPTIIEMAGELWAGALGGELASWAATRLADAEIGLRTGAQVVGLTGRFTTVGDERLHHDLCVAGIGVRPSTGLAETAGLAIDDGIVTDAEHRTSAPGIWAAGDVARVDGRRVEHWHAARESGERAALSMLGLPVPARRASWVFSEVAGAAIDVVGDARAWDEARWLAAGAVLAYLEGERVVQVAIIGSAIPVEDARGAVERGAPVGDLLAMLPVQGLG